MDLKMERVLIQVPKDIKNKLDGLRGKGYTVSGYIRTLLEKDLMGREGKSHGRKTT